MVVDIGGLHSSKSKFLNVTTLGLTKSQVYSFDLFWINRHKSVDPALNITTQLQFLCPYKDWCGICYGDGQSCCKCSSTSSQPCKTASCNPTTGSCVYTNTVINFYLRNILIVSN